MMRMFHLFAALLLLLPAPAAAQPASAQAGVDALLAADRGFSASAAQAADAASGLAPMLDAEIVMPMRGRGHVVGREAVVAAVRDSPAFREGRMQWAPVRAGISADGTQGFTFGYLTLSGGDPALRNRKYLAYWVRRPEGWRVAAYRQTVRPEGEISTELLPASLPGFAAEPSADPAVTAAPSAQPRRRRAGLFRPRPAGRAAHCLSRLWPA